MLVDGSGVPQVFKMAASSTKDWRLYELRFLFTANFVLTDGDHFGPIKTLSNGLHVEMMIDNQTYDMGNVKITEDFFTLVAGSLPVILQGPKDILVAGIQFENATHSAPGVLLRSGSTDEVRVTIRDDLTHPQLKLLRGLIFYTEE